MQSSKKWLMSDKILNFDINTWNISIFDSINQKFKSNSGIDIFRETFSQSFSCILNVRDTKVSKKSIIVYTLVNANNRSVIDFIYSITIENMIQKME